MPDQIRNGRLRQPATMAWRRPSRRRWGSRVRIVRAPRTALVVLALLTVLAAASTLAGGGDVDRGELLPGVPVDTEAGEARGDPPGRTDRSARDDPGERWRVFARYEGLQLRLPHPDPLGLRFVEGRRVGAVGLDPVGELTANANPESFDPATVRPSPDGPQFAVAAPAGRGRPPTSAAVVTVPRGARVGAPTAAEVTAVEPYPSGNGRDWRVLLAPRAREDLQVTVTGLHRPAVAAGDAVEPGDTLAVPRLAPNGHPEVSIEAGSANAPATLDVDQR